VYTSKVLQSISRVTYSFMFYEFAFNNPWTSTKFKINIYRLLTVSFNIVGHILTVTEKVPVRVVSIEHNCLLDISLSTS